MAPLPCFKRPDPTRHINQFVRYGVAGGYSSRRPRLLDEQLLPALKCRYTPFELMKFVTRGGQAFHKLCDVLEKVFNAAGQLPNAA